MRNKKQWMLMATIMLPLAVSADTLSEKLEMADTTFTVNGKKIVVDDRQEQTIISVYSPDGEEMLKKKDKERADYYNYYTFGNWGVASTYDLCLDSSKIGIEGTADLIIDFARRANLL